MLFVCYPQIFHKNCLQFLLGVKMAPRDTENNTYAKFWGDKQRALWSVMVFSGVVNSPYLHKKKKTNWMFLVVVLKWRHRALALTVCLLCLTLKVPMVTNINFLLTISIHCQEIMLWELIKRDNALIFYQILSTHSLWKCIEISVEKLYVDIGA